MDPEETPGEDGSIGEPPEPFSFPDVMVIGSGPWDLGPGLGAGRFLSGDLW